MSELIAFDYAQANGLPHFFDGEPCKLGHVARKRTKNRECMECARVRASEHYHANRDAIRSKRVEQYASNPAFAQVVKDRAAKYRATVEPDALRAKDAEYYAANRGAIKERSRAWGQSNRQRKAAANREWNKANPDQARRHQRAYEKRKRESDPVHAMKERIGAAIRQSLIKGGYTKKNRVHDIIGCTFADFAKHIERQFAKGMTWANRSEWHLDHIIPISSAQSEADVIRLHHFTNLRPLWAHENAAKGDAMVVLL
jgi:hypothetical protein